MKQRSLRHVGRSVVVCVLSMVAFFARVAHARDPVELKTADFSVVSVLSESETRRLVDEIRTFQAVVAGFSSIKDFRPIVPLRIHLVDTPVWKKYLQPSKNVAGYMSRRPLGFDAVMDAYSWSNASTILFHEYMHFAIRNASTGAYPMWFDEGMAGFVSTIRKTGTKVVRVGEPPVEILLSLRGVGRASWIPVRELLRLKDNPANDDDEEGRQVNGFYAQCWAVVHYMFFAQPEGGKSLSRYVALRQKGTEIEAAFRDSFGMTVDEFDEKLRRYVQQTAYKVVSIEVDKLNFRAVEEPQVRQLSKSENSVDLGRLLVRMGARHESSIQYFDGLLKSEPANARALAGKANVLVQMEKDGEADVAITKALALAPDDQSVLISAGNIHFVRYNRGARGGKIANRDELMSAARQAFEYYDRAMRLPDKVDEQPEIVNRYAGLALQTHANFEQPLRRLMEARKAYPTCPELALVHAQILMAMDRDMDARPAWQVVATFGSGTMRANALKILER